MADVQIAVLDAQVPQVVISLPGIQGAAGPSGGVQSVNGRTGAVVLTKSDVGLGNVPNTDCTNASNISSGTLASARLPELTGGDLTSSVGSAVLYLTTTGVAPATYGNSSATPQITVDSKGRITSASNVTVTPDWGSIVNKPAFVASAFADTTVASNIVSGTLSASRLPTSVIQNTIIDAKGDLIVGSGADAVARLPVGANGQLLVADSTQTAGVRWTSPDAASNQLSPFMLMG